MTLDPIALYGAILATVLALIQLRQFWLDRPRLRLEVLAMGEVVYRGGEEGFVPVQPESVEIRATNDGRRPAYVPQIGLVLSDGCRESYLIEDGRQKLDEGQTVSARVPKTEIIRHTAQHPFGTTVVGLYAGFPGLSTASDFDR